MRAGGSKQKGASFERLVCVKLSLWVSRGKQEDCFWRSSMSGGRSTVGHAKGKRLAAQAGDISAVHSIGNPLVDRFLIECKAYKQLNFQGLLTSKGVLVEFWREAKMQAKRYNKQPILIAKQNMLTPILCLTFQHGLSLGKTRPVLKAPRINMQIYLLDEFLETAEPP